ncbi:MAG: T9SS type A sorting domain-containing protein [Bacteroidota bacterium]
MNINLGAGCVILVLSLLVLSPGISAQDGLDAYITASSEVVGPGERTTYTITVSNTSPVDLQNVEAEAQLPGSIFTFDRPSGTECFGDANRITCSANERLVWTVGTLAPGQSKTIFFRVQISTSASEGILPLPVEAVADNADPTSAAVAVQVDPTPLLRLSIAPDPGPAVAGEPFTYTLTFGNVGSSSPSDVTLSMAVPEGASFVSATGGGVEQDGVVSWNIGLVPASRGVQVDLIIRPEPGLPDGTLLHALAEVDPNASTEVVIESSVVTPVRSGSPLQLAYGVSQTATGPSDPLTFTLTATNTGPVDLLDVSARVLLPGGIVTFNRPSDTECFGDANRTTCAANERLVWTVGTLAPGQSEAITFTPTVSSGAQVGNILITLASATSSNAAVNQALDWIGILTGTLIDLVPPSAPLDLSAVAGDGEVVLSWTANTEGDLSGYRLYRDTSPGASTLLASVGAGATNYTDADLASDTYYYRLTAFDTAGNESGFSEEVEVAVVNTAIETDEGLPTTLVLGSSYPNPFLQTTTIPFDLPEATDVALTVYSALGERVAVLADQPFTAGRYRAEWKPEGLAAGIYVVHLRAGDFVATRKLVLLR